jgi:phosphatidylserine/phosphatidylglycerophosphate/cardiolipin synthase-like enzyme
MMKIDRFRPARFACSPQVLLALLFGILASTPAPGQATRPVTPERPRTVSVIPIAEARANTTQGVPLLLNQTVTVSGIVTVGNQLGLPAYIQDASGGIAVYDGAFSDSVTIGDEVTISGLVTQYNGLTELNPVTILERVSSGNTVEPVIVTIGDLLADGVNGLEKYEGSLVQINAVSVNTATWSVTGAGTNYQISDGNKQMDVRVDKDVDFANKPAPGGSFTILGVISQYQRTSPYVGGYQLMPRMAADIQATGPRILSMPFEKEITSGSVTLLWNTLAPASPGVRFWENESSALLGTATGAAGTEQIVRMDGLQPATIYRIQAFSIDGPDTSFVRPMYVCTAAATSAGTMNVYFNRAVDNLLYPPLPAQGNVNLKNKLLDRIDAARFSIDAAFYSLSGTSGDDIVAALRSARDRGVSVRVIIEADNSSSAAISTLRGSGVPVIFDTFDPVNAGAGLMHNKFLVIDARDRGSDVDDWVVTGSWNATDQGLLQDAQNCVEIQDQALATIYTKEFDEMWGSSGAAPSASTARFGARKTNNTPHQCQVRGTRIEVFFCPSDRSTEYLVSVVRRARFSVYFAILTFTRDDIAAAMIDRKNAGVRVRGVMDNSSDQGSEYQTLRTAGVDVFLKKNVPGLLHHKYMVLDGDDRGAGADPVVVTGSSNWSTSAETSNNENVIGIHNRDLALQYLQEWYQRYRDAGGTAGIVLAADGPAAAPEAVALRSIAPNPARSGEPLRIACATPPSALAQVVLFDALGRQVRSWSFEASGGGASLLMVDPGPLPGGSYRLQLSSGSSSRTAPLLILR